MTKARNNRTLEITSDDISLYGARLKRLDGPASLGGLIDSTICQDVQAILDWLPERSVDLIFADPPYNLTKEFNGRTFAEVPLEEYRLWLEAWLPRLHRLLKPTGSMYVCSDWRSSGAVHAVLDRHFIVRNRITWEREKGRGAGSNWKNCSEDIWFCTASNDYTFNAGAVKLKRSVIAPYTTAEGRPKDWSETDDGRFRLTFPSNVWTDLTVPFWSMPENTVHPTQKPEKLLAKVILASSNTGDVVFDPFLGSGTTSVVARKLNRRFIGVEIDEAYCALAEKRLELALGDSRIQGYEDGVFWERNALARRDGSSKKDDGHAGARGSLFPAATPGGQVSDGGKGLAVRKGRVCRGTGAGQGVSQ